MKMDLGLLLLRLVFGGFMFLGHGLPKLMNWSQMSESFPDPLGIGPFPSYLGTVFTEVLCAAALSLGLFTRWASLALLFTMLVAGFVVHWADPFFMSGSGAKEPALLFAGAYLALFLTGPGRFSLDSMLRKI